MGFRWFDSKECIMISDVMNRHFSFWGTIDFILFASKTPKFLTGVAPCGRRLLLRLLKRVGTPRTTFSTCRTNRVVRGVPNRILSLSNAALPLRQATKSRACHGVANKGRRYSLMHPFWHFQNGSFWLLDSGNYVRFIVRQRCCSLIDRLPECSVSYISLVCSWGECLGRWPVDSGRDA